MTLSLSNFMSTIGTKHYYRTTPQTNIGDHLFWNCREIHDKKFDCSPFQRRDGDLPNLNFFYLTKTLESNQHTF